MLLESYLLGASAHFLINIHSLDTLIRRNETARDRASKAATASEINTCTNNLPMCLIWPVDFALRAWKIIKLRP
jgi:hypothetical protein